MGHELGVALILGKFFRQIFDSENKVLLSDDQQ